MSPDEWALSCAKRIGMARSPLLTGGKLADIALPAAVVRAALAQIRLFDLAAPGNIGGALTGLRVYEIGVYVWHRSMHG